MDTAKVVDLTCTVVGALLIAALAWALVTGSYDFSQWKMPAVVGGIGVVLMLPFRQLMKLADWATGALPFLDSGKSSNH